MHAKRRVGELIVSYLLAGGCGAPVEIGGSGDTDEWAEATEAATPAALVAEWVEPTGSLSTEEIQRLAYEFRYRETPVEPRAEPLAPLRALSAEDFRRFRVALVELSPMGGFLRDMYDSYTNVLYEHRVFMLDAGPELLEEALRRAFAQHPDEFGPEIVEHAVQHLRTERIPPHLRAHLH